TRQPGQVLDLTGSGMLRMDYAEPKAKACFLSTKTSILPDGERELALLASTGGVAPRTAKWSASGRACAQSHHHEEFAFLPLPSSRTSTSVRTSMRRIGNSFASVPRNA